MQLLQLEHFAPRLNEVFSVELEGERSPFVLVEARPLNRRPSMGQVREPFSLLFRHEAAVVLPQKTYSVHNESLGEFGLFLVPVARDQTGFIYQAIFN